MANQKDKFLMRITLAEDRKKTILSTLTAFYADEFDEELSQYRAERILEFFVLTLGPPVYNQAIQDARKFMSDKLDELDADFYESEPPQDNRNDGDVS